MKKTNKNQDKESGKWLEGMTPTAIIARIIIALVIFAVIVVGFFFLLVGLYNCRGDDIRSNGTFRYIVENDHTDKSSCNGREFIAIVDFADGSLEEVEIPREIEGKPVQYIGYMNRGESNWMAAKYYRIKCPDLKKIYVYDNIKTIHQNAFDDSLGIKMMYCSITFDMRLHGYEGSNKIYVYKSLFESIGSNASRHFLIGNVEFMNNYSDGVNGGYYRLDNVEGEEKISEPPKPERDGYEFMGWYTEQECINEWDFDISPEIEEDTQFRLYAKWRAL